MKNVISQVNLTEGAAWTFVHSDGRHTVYEYHACIAQGYQDPKTSYGLSPMHKLLNPETGKFAMVSEKWLREGPISSGSSPTGFGSHWLIGEVAAEIAEAA